MMAGEIRATAGMDFCEQAYKLKWIRKS